MSTFVHGLWRRIRPARRRSPGRPIARHHAPPRFLGSPELLEHRVLLNADAGSAHHPPFADYWILPPPPAEVSTDPGHEATWVGPSVPPPTTDSKPPGGIGPNRVDPIGPPPASFPAPRTLLGRVRAIEPGFVLDDGRGNSLASTTGTFGQPFGFSTPVDMAWPGTNGSDWSIPAPPLLMGPPSPEELATIPRAGWTRVFSYDGEFEADESTAIRIPVGPATENLKLDVRPSRDGVMYAPQVDEMYLVGPRGETLAVIGGVNYLAHDNGQTLFITLRGAPVGGELVVRITRSLPGYEAPPKVDGAGDTPMVDGEGSLPPWDPGGFEITIQRSDAGPAVTIVPPPSPTGLAYLGILPFTSVDRTAIWNAPSMVGSTTPSIETAAVDQAAGEVTPADQADADFDQVVADEEVPAVFLGPLVSRTAAPLGPVLATIHGNPAPSTDRADRADAEGRDADAELDLLLGLKLAEGGREVADLEAAWGDGIGEIRGANGLPLLVSSVVPKSPRNDRQALGETVQLDETGEEALAALGPPEAVEPDPEVARAGLATRAVGFLIGLGLASGPLYPDLVALARRKLVRRKRPSRRRVGR